MNSLGEDSKERLHLSDGAGRELESVLVNIVSKNTRTGDHDVHVRRRTTIVQFIVHACQATLDNTCELKRRTRRFRTDQAPLSRSYTVLTQELIIGHISLQFGLLPPRS